jgi:hypothetical protein
MDLPTREDIIDQFGPVPIVLSGLRGTKAGFSILMHGIPRPGVTA